MTDNSERIIYLHKYVAPCGSLLLGSYNDELCLCDWASERPRDVVDSRLRHYLNARYEWGEPDVIRLAVSELNEYFARKRTQFDVPICTVGTDFQRQVWTELMNIPYGTHISYKDQARRINRPNAVRAVANANSVNAISIFIPCHRVVGVDGDLAGYAGGVAAKKYLLELER